jgi:hypothetical protein
MIIGKADTDVARNGRYSLTVEMLSESADTIGVNMKWPATEQETREKCNGN